MLSNFNCDLDYKNKFIPAYYFLKALFIVPELESIELKKSSSGNHHLIIWSNKFLSLNKKYYYRKVLGDDIKRIRMDKQRTFGRDTLFSKKTKMTKSEKWIRNVKL